MPHDCGRLEQDTHVAALAATMARAGDLARSAGPPAQVTLEHLLLALTEDEEAAPSWRSARSTSPASADDIARPSRRLGASRRRGTNHPPIAPELKRIVEAAAAAARVAGPEWTARSCWPP